MQKIDEMVGEFLALKTIAVVGVSDRRDTGCNSNYQKFKAAGYKVFAINPRIQTFDGDPCYPDLRALPQKPDGVFILAKPSVTEAIVQQCADLGVEHIWMHCMLGTKPGLGGSMTSVSAAAVENAARHGIKVIPGSCPNQFLKADPGHALMRKLFRAFGFLKVA
jgi:predicted CoA-binding protein